MIVTDPSDYELGERACDYRNKSVSASTMKNRQLQWDSYVRTCIKYDWPVFPCNVHQACMYVTYLADRLAYSSIITYYSAVVYMHTCMGIEPVRFSNHILKATLEGIARVSVKGSDIKDPLLPRHLKKIANVVNINDVWESITFVCMLVLFRTLLRVSHAVASDHTLLRSNLVFNSSGFMLAVRSSETSSNGQPIQYLPVMFAKDKEICAVVWLRKFLAISPVRKGDQLFSVGGKKLTYNVFSARLKALLVKACIKGNFASHSLRPGGATHMSMIYCSLAEIKARGGWKSDCVFRYIRQPMSHKLKVEKAVAKSV